EMLRLSGEMIDTPVTPELVAARVMNELLTDYEEARSVRAAYDEVVALIRQEIPDFLRQRELFESIVKELEPDERLTYVAATPVGAVTLLIEGSDTTPSRPIVSGWWDERLTSTQVRELLVGSSTMDGKVQNRHGGLLSPSSRGSQLRRVLGRILPELGVREGVFAELAMHCRAARVRRLVLIPCGLLGLLPLHAAMIPCADGSEETEPLIDVVQVNYAPSSRIWATARRRNAGGQGKLFDAFIVGDPQPQSEEIPPLPGARNEAMAISVLIDQERQKQVATLLGETATYSNVVGILRKRGAMLTHLHFACHGFSDLINPQASGVLLADGVLLTMHDVLDAALAPLTQLRLVVLSACRTALVGTDLPDEAVGLPSAWLQAGARDVLASLWPVSDAVTFMFMAKFYELHLLDGLEPADACWLAQRWLRGLPTWREDFRAMGAVRATMDAEAGVIVHELLSARDLAESGDDSELRVNEADGTSLEQKNEDKESPGLEGNTIEQRKKWSDPYHWAAFAVYGA
ncbi:MAG TPA: CHAT domain-containing protein, partial [Ktedonobacteraceae bacterium]|nr:CHAT domain-containing protein [Ktedonobacteraceae bacterium]